MTQDPKQPSEFVERLCIQGRKALQVGADMSYLLVHLQNPTPTAMLAVGAKLLTVIEAARKISCRDFVKTWTHVDLGGWGTLCFEEAKSQGLLKPLDTIQIEWHNELFFEGQIHGVRTFWRHYNGSVFVWCKGSQADLYGTLGRLIWETVGPQAKLQVTEKNRSAQYKIVVDNLTTTLPSQRGQDLFNVLQKYRERGRGRTVLLYGEPGVGKSQLMRYVSKLAGGFSFRIDARDLSSLCLTQLFDLLHPSVILVDDFDRARNSSEILSEIEALRDKRVLLLVSVNDPKLLDHAVLRAGRFDEYIHIDKLDDEIISAKIGDVDEATEAILRSMPIAYIDAYHDDVEVLGKERALDRVQEHKKRHELVRSLAHGKKKT